jgi:hypothetical protein
MTDKPTYKPDPMGATDLPKYNGWPLLALRNGAEDTAIARAELAADRKTT